MYIFLRLKKYKGHNCSKISVFLIFVFAKILLNVYVTKSFYLETFKQFGCRRKKMFDFLVAPRFRKDSIHKNYQEKKPEHLKYCEKINYSIKILFMSTILMFGRNYFLMFHNIKQKRLI